MTDYIPLRWKKAGYADSKHLPGKEMGRGEGKTTKAIAEVLKMAMKAKGPQNFFYITKTREMAVRAFSSVNEEVDTNLTVYWSQGKITVKKNGATIFFISGNNPDVIRGVQFHGGVVDEANGVDPKIWTEVLQYSNKGTCRLYGTGI